MTRHPLIRFKQRKLLASFLHRHGVGRIIRFFAKEETTGFDSRRACLYPATGEGRKN